ncbi:hypothetical protein CBER1_10199 [Cercospora berteroae]|uniref:UBC core domain-containing protein n=1 Tax=Cercospora berteroae TaxID=357750 RepID=A0A2S6C6H6_9PEZI|nr:hypothetical protein CBER1_10199 [Cercospora berteroae]
MMRKRLPKDIDELLREPYPGIELHVNESDITKACLVLTPEGEEPLHLQLEFSAHYPVIPPDVTIQSSISHPNIFGDRLCLNMLDFDNAYTPAYTLKGICIQLLSFFASDSIEQMWGENGGKVDRKKWQARGTDGMGLKVLKQSHNCTSCGFGDADARHRSTRALPAPTANAYEPVSTISTTSKDPNHVPVTLQDLPAEILLSVLDYLDDEHIFTAARAWEGFGDIMREYNVIRTRELQCFALKQSFRELELGVGVRVEGRALTSEFDLLSRDAFQQLGIRSSIQGLPFSCWLPLPLAESHWARVRKSSQRDINAIASRANISGGAEQVIYAFMNEVVVRLSKEAEEFENGGRYVLDDGPAKSTLTHASEKAIESYFHLFHLLLCLACENNEIIRNADRTINAFISGSRSKDHVPNLGHLLIMILISDIEINEAVIDGIIEEAITRNVVWTLDSKGRNMPELSFMETDTISKYRLHETFEACTTSWRLLMFLKFMQETVRNSRNVTDLNTNEVMKMTLPQLRDSLFDRHGAPPNNAAAELATTIKNIHLVKNFPEFLKVMHNRDPTQTAGDFTLLLRRTVHASMEKGYSQWALTQEQALHLRLTKEPNVGRPAGMFPQQPGLGNFSFFPGQQRDGGNGGRGGCGGRGGRGWRGRGR